MAQTNGGAAFIVKVARVHHAQEKEKLCEESPHSDKADVWMVQSFVQHLELESHHRMDGQVIDRLLEM